MMTRAESYWEAEKILHLIDGLKSEIRRWRFRKGDAGRMMKVYTFSSDHRRCDVNPYIRDCARSIEVADHKIVLLKNRLARHEERLAGIAA